MLKVNIAFQLICYYSAWFCGLALAADNKGLWAAVVILTITLVQLIWQYTIIKRTHGLSLMMALFVSFGFIGDSFLQAGGFLQFNANPFFVYSPPWMISVWLNFSVLFYSILQSLFYRYALVGILSFIFFPVAYILGVKMGAAILLQGYLSIFFIGAIWALLMPLCLLIYNRYEARNG